jgi:hypothetical protein
MVRHEAIREPSICMQEPYDVTRASQTAGGSKTEKARRNVKAPRARFRMQSARLDRA